MRSLVLALSVAAFQFYSLTRMCRTKDQEHVDGTGRFAGAFAEGDGWIVRIEFPACLARYLVEKSSIAVDGISLTVATLGEEWFEIAIIPHTWKVTNLSALARGSELLAPITGN